MSEPNPVVNVKFVGTNSEEIQNAFNYFQEWAGEGGLVEAFNPALEPEHKLNVTLTDSGSGWLELTVEPV